MQPSTFQASFWSPSASVDRSPNFSYGVDVLYKKLTQSTEENQAIAEYVTRRLAAEQAYVDHLKSIVISKPNTSTGTGTSTSTKAFERDLGGGLKRCFQKIKDESQETARGHRIRVESLTDDVLEPLSRFSSHYKQLVDQSKSRVDKQISAFEQAVQKVELAKSAYHVKCGTLDSLWPSDPLMPSLSTGTNTSNRNSNATMSSSSSLTPTSRKRSVSFLHHTLSGRSAKHPHWEIAHLLDELHKERPGDLDGKLILDWIKDHLAALSNPHIQPPRSSTEEAIAVCHQLVELQMLQPLKGNSCRFEPLDTTIYSVHPHGIGGYHFPMAESLDLTEPLKSPTASISSNLTYSGGSFTSLLGRLGQRSQRNQEKQFQLANQEMMMAEKVYRESVQLAEKMRLQTEESLSSYYDDMENLELERIETLKQIFATITTLLANTLPLFSETYDCINIYQEAIRPDKEVQFIVEQYRTGRFCPRPILYENHYEGPAVDQVFGVALDEVAQYNQSLVPPFIANAINSIASATTDLHEDEREKTWTTMLPLDLVHAARQELNVSPEKTALDKLERFDVLVLASLVRLYLLELPECLLTFELYEPAKTIYLQHNEQSIEEECRITSVAKMMTTLASANFYTLKTIIYHFHTLFKKDSFRLNALASLFGPILLRPVTESTKNIHDKHPQRLFRDLIIHFDKIFSRDMHKTQEDNVNRRAIVAIPDLMIRSSTSTDLSFLPPLSLCPTDDSSDDYSDKPRLSRDDSLSVAISGFVTSSPRESLTLETGRNRSFFSLLRRQDPSVTQQKKTPPANLRLQASSRVPLPSPFSITLFEDPEESIAATPRTSQSISVSDQTSVTLQNGDNYSFVWARELEIQPFDVDPLSLDPLFVNEH
ncbi:hypothetical protein J3Q64DRAFT_1753454 [Phycomyces blakesleeanus]|uniref:Rho-GAP domain-containing protein n=2 Tax=Phycomyces blakesleeanus TaxID=4837 RepID=A0ABR3AV84_PHYBL